MDFLVDNLVNKYGEGKTQEYKCKTCEYTQNIRSGGVHVSDGGSVMVFSTEDEFYCPICESNECEKQLPNECSGK